MKAVFIYRYIDEARYSLIQIHALLEKTFIEDGSDVRVHRANSVLEVLEKARYYSSKGYRVVIGYSLLSTVLPRIINEVKWLSGEVHKTRNTILVAGGPHATGDPLGTLGLGFDVVVHGEAESSLPALLENFAEKGFEGLYSVKGIVIMGDEGAVYTGRQPPASLDDYPPFPYWRGIFSPIEITRGCIWGCRYCEVPYMHGARIRHRSPEYISYYARLFWASGRRDLRFITPNAFSYMSDGRNIRVEHLCGLLYSLRRIASEYKARIFMGSFPSEVRPEHATIRDAVRCLRDTVSNKSVIIGAQSGSNRILETVNRGHNVETVEEAVRMLNTYGFNADVDFIYAFPFEDEEDLRETLSFSEKLVERYRARIHAHYFLPLPGTPLEQLEPKDPPEWFMKRLFKLMGRGKLYGDWLKQREISRAIVELRRKGIIVGLKGWRLIRRV